MLPFILARPDWAYPRSGTVYEFLMQSNEDIAVSQALPKFINLARRVAL